MEQREKYINRPDIDSLFDDFDHPNPNINLEACIGMVRFWPKESIAKLMVNLDSNDIALRRKTIKALGHFGMDALNTIIARFADSKDRNTRISCLKVLVHIAARNDFDKIPKALYNLIEQSFLDDTPEAILTVITLLRQLGDQATPMLIKASKDENVLRSKAAITALGELHEPCIENWLIELIADTTRDELILKGAIDALENFQSREKKFLNETFPVNPR